MMSARAADPYFAYSATKIVQMVPSLVGKTLTDALDRLVESSSKVDFGTSNGLTATITLE